MEKDAVVGRVGSSNAPSAVRLEADGRELVFEIADEGPGFDVAQTARGMGLQIIQDRIDALDGWLTVASTPSGTTVTGRVPAVATERIGAPS
jgi:signal transduction histidine kinase